MKGKYDLGVHTVINTMVLRFELASYAKMTDIS